MLVTLKQAYVNIRLQEAEISGKSQDQRNITRMFMCAVVLPTIFIFCIVPVWAILSIDWKITQETVKQDQPPKKYKIGGVIDDGWISNDKKYIEVRPIH